MDFIFEWQKQYFKLRLHTAINRGGLIMQNWVTRLRPIFSERKKHLSLIKITKILKLQKLLKLKKLLTLQKLHCIFPCFALCFLKTALLSDNQNWEILSSIFTIRQKWYQFHEFFSHSIISCSDALSFTTHLD